RSPQLRRRGRRAAPAGGHLGDGPPARGDVRAPGGPPAGPADGAGRSAGHPRPAGGHRPPRPAPPAPAGNTPAKPRGALKSESSAPPRPQPVRLPIAGHGPLSRRARDG